MFGTKFYTKYFSIVQRCNDPNSTSYPRYGALGIKNLWTSFEEFRDDMYESYLAHIAEFGERQTTIDRIDSKGDYCKENCRWATYKEQARNTSKNRYMTLDGVTKTTLEWSEEKGVHHQTVLSRLNRGWDDERVFSTRRHTKFGELKYVEFRGENKLLTTWSKELGIKYHTLYARLFTFGWPIERAFTTKVK